MTMRETSQTKRGIHFVAVTPPPVNGMTLMSAAMRDALSQGGTLCDYPVTNPKGLKGLRWTLYKHLQVWRGIRQASRAAQASDVCYMVPDSGGGLMLNRFEMRHLAKHFAHVFLHHHVFNYVAANDPHMAHIMARLGPNVTHIVLGPEMEQGLKAQYGQDISTVTLGNAALVQPAVAPRARTGLETVGYLSHVSLPKGIDRFIDTVRRADQTGPALNAVIAGPLADADIGDRVAEFIAENPSNRHYIGPVHGAEKEAFWQQVDVLLFPSRYAQEAQPVTIFEALTQEIPVLATPRGCIPSQLPDTNWVLPEDQFVSDAAAQITAWRQDKGSYQAAVVKAKSIWERHHMTDSARLAQIVGTITQGQIK